MKKVVVASTLLVFLLLALFLSTGESSGASAPRPNVLIIIADDQPDGTLGLMENVQRIFGRGGTNFVNGYASTGVCCPARASIMTGQHVHNHGVYSNQGSVTAKFPINRSVQWQLQQRGYKTALFGKFLNRWEDKKNVRGFDAYWGNKGTTFAKDEAITRKFKNFVANQESKDGTPWMTILGYHSPHGPWRESGAEYPWTNRDPSVGETDFSDKPPFIRRVAAQTRSLFKRGKMLGPNATRRGQLREINLLDETVADAFSYLENKGEANNTLAFYIADQGFMWGQHGIITKFLPYREVLEIPFLARWPGRIGRGDSSRLVSSVDIAPTIYDALNITPSYTPDGRSILRNNNLRDWVYSEMTAGSAYSKPWMARLTPNSSYIETRYGGNIYREYYNLFRDPFQMRSSLPPSGLGALEADLDQARNCRGAACH